MKSARRLVAAEIEREIDRRCDALADRLSSPNSHTGSFDRGLDYGAIAELKSLRHWVREELLQCADAEVSQ